MLVVRVVHKNNGNKWKNHFFKMKGDIGVAQSTKKKRTRGHFTAKSSTRFHNFFKNENSAYTNVTKEHATITIIDDDSELNFSVD